MTQNAEQLIRDIEDMKVKGAYLITKVALDALAMRAADAAAEGAPITETLLATAERLELAQPSMASVANGCAYVLAPLAQSNTFTPEQIQQLVATRSQEFLAASEQAQEKVLTVGASLIQDGDVIFMHSYTGTLLGIYRRARETGKQFSVIATESRPYGEGRFMTSELLKLGIPCTLVIDAAMASYIGRASKSLVGIDSISANGSVVNKIGTELLALACQAYGVPLYAAGSVLKLSIKSVRGEPVQMLKRKDDGGIAPAEIADNPNLTVVNQIFDLTPGRYFTGLITDQGILPPAAISEFRNHPLLRPAPEAYSKEQQS